MLVKVTVGEGQGGEQRGPEMFVLGEPLAEDCKILCITELLLLLLMLLLPLLLL